MKYFILILLLVGLVGCKEKIKTETKSDIVDTLLIQYHNYEKEATFFRDGAETRLKEYGYYGISFDNDTFYLKEWEVK